MEVSAKLYLAAPIGYEAGRAPEPAWTRWLREEAPFPTGNRTPLVQPVA